MYGRNLEHRNFDRISMKILQKQIESTQWCENYVGGYLSPRINLVDRFNKSITYITVFFGSQYEFGVIPDSSSKLSIFHQELVLNCYIFPEWLDYCTRRCILSTSGYISQETSGYSRSFFRQNRNSRRDTESSHIFGRILWL